MNVKTLIGLAGVLALSSAVVAQNATPAPSKDEKAPAKEQPKKEAAPANPAPVTAPGGPATTAPGAKLDIVDTAMSTKMHGTLCAALKAAGWVEPLKGKGPFTVFAPTDEAFKKLGKAVDDLLKPENKDKLANILKYHVIQGAAVSSADVMKMKESSKTVQGSVITITVKEGKVWLNGSAMVTKADVACSNGVIHVIDTVLMPADKAPEKKDEKKDAKPAAEPAPAKGK